MKTEAAQPGLAYWSLTSYKTYTHMIVNDGGDM